MRRPLAGFQPDRGGGEFHHLVLRVQPGLGAVPRRTQQALRVVRRQPFDDALLTRAGETSGVYCELIDGPFFRVAKLTGSAALPNERFGRECLVLPLSEGVTLDEQPLPVGSCTIARGLRGLALRPDASAILVEETRVANA